MMANLPSDRPPANLPAAPSGQPSRPPANLPAAPSGQPSRPPGNLPAAPSGPPSRPPANLKAAPSGRPPQPIHRYRRFAGYDYSRGASIFITVSLARRFAAFGRVNGASVALSPAGEALAETVAAENLRCAAVTVRSLALMPDHLHMRVTLRPGEPQPLKTLGRFVANIKRWSKWKASKFGVEIEWQQGYHDRICNSAEINRLVDSYIANNPLKWSLMHGPNPPLKVVEPFESPRVDAGEWWTAVGNAGLFGPERRIAALRLSRRIPQTAFGEVIRRCLGAARKGYVAASTFISPCERAVHDALVAAKAPTIRAVPDPLATVYRPKGDEPRLFAEGRLLLLSRVCAPGTGRADAWHGMNDCLAAAARANGVSLYVVHGPNGLEWRFER